MNTKTSLKRVYNYYSGTEHGVGRDSPGALLDMLAEVASQTLHSEKKWTESNVPLKSQSKRVSVKRKCQQEPSFTTSQLLAMPATQLVKQFSVFNSDELKRQYSYTCALVPGCGQRYTSFASEGRARMSIKAHLADHLDYLKRDKDAYSTFTAIAVKQRSPKSSPATKKMRANQQKKPVEVLNKENKESKSEKSTNYLRKILSNEMSFVEFEKQKTLAKMNKITEEHKAEVKKEPQDISGFQVLGDHSYYEHVKVDNNDEKTTPDLNEIMVNQAMGENIMLMVVESDGVHMKELPYIAQDISVPADQDESESIYVPESVTWSEDPNDRNMEMSVPSKPKGKAKFIGTSKEEREMALALMDRIKRKGNPAGGNLQCRICDPPRTFTAPTTLVSHYRSHAGIKPYECRICRAVFTRRHSLKYHMLIHQNQTRFTCADCGKKFRHPSHFREHRRRHTGEAPFGCEDCGQRFKTRNTYKRHLKTRHGKVLTTTGELLHLSEEDFQKVRTNPKRRSETINSESMVDEDVTAPKAIIQFQNQDVNEPEVNLQIGAGLETNYEALDKDSETSCNEFWDNENVVAVGDTKVKADRYRNYEYFHDSQEDKTDDIKTEIGVNNLEFVKVENVLETLKYNEEIAKDDVTMDDRCISVGTKGDNDVDDVRVVKTGEATFDDSFDTRSEVLYNENSNKTNTDLIEYVEGIDVTGCGDNTMAYEHDASVLNPDEDCYNLHDQQEETCVHYFEDNLSLENEIEYEESVEIPEQVDEDPSIGGYDEMRVAVENGESSQLDIVDPLQSEEMINCEEENQRLLIGNDRDGELSQDNNSSHSDRDTTLRENQGVYILGETEVAEEDGEAAGVEERERTKTQYSNQFILQEQSPTLKHQSSRANVAVEHIVQYPMTNYEAEANHAHNSHNSSPRIYLQTNQSNNITIENKGLISFLTQRINLQQKSTDNIALPKSGNVVKLLNGHPQSFNLLQNGKQSTVLLVASSSNKIKNNFLQSDADSDIGIKALPVITVHQK
ncbi:uncharacterized protein LOC124179376 isoform X1 [Neodiprion fabricii]|uniref:uncharacterized protein LOC124179376 isoform X1 n=2 Tax=Neodiprion fabricii TaxID=2872261 RepID=UPI001ED94247|nr:uncharacterized protein LOC124179376 isoform X1 [Neodiprion fabricii]